MPEPLRVAAVGAGYFSQFHYEAWARMPRVELAGVCDADEAKARAVSEKHGGQVFTDAAAMLDALQPDLFDIITPPGTHQAMVEAGAARGTPMVCQKPLAPTLPEAVRVVETAEQAGVLLAVHENFRFQPWYRHARDLLDAGALGTPHGIAFRMRPGDGQGPRAYLDRQPYFQQMERFLIHETGIHIIDTFRYLLGEIDAVYARLRRLNPVIAGEDAGIVVFDFASGAAGLLDGNRLNDHVAENHRFTMGEMWLEGSGGVLRLDGAGRLHLKPHHELEREEPYTWEDRGFAGDSVFATQAHIVAHLLDGAPLANSGRDYLVNIRVEEAVYRSHAEGRRVPVAEVEAG